jgi:molecular chaperone GrpE
MVGEKTTADRKSQQQNDFFDQFRQEIARIEAEKAKAESESAETLDRLRRLQADLENLQKISKREAENVTRLANERLMVNLLPILDSLEKALSVKQSEGEVDVKEMLVGIGLLSKELMRVLKDEGLERIDTAGALFDPNLHEAASFVQSEEYPDEAIVEELRAGYRLRGRVIRPSMVVIARKEMPEQTVKKGSS